MNKLHDSYQSYSWHQSHDQATILLLVPHDTLEEDVSVIIERNYLVAGVKGQAPIVKGRLYGNVDTANSMWQLEPRASRISTRERATSTTSTESTQSSYALVSDPDISSSFAASLDNGLLSDVEDVSSPALSSPISSSMDDHLGFVGAGHRRHQHTMSYPESPPTHLPAFSLTSSYSSVESLHVASGRLLTLHLEKAESVIWPSLVVGPVPENLSPESSLVLSGYPWASSSTEEAKYNSDPTSLVLIALELYDVREAFEDAFEYFVRAWHQAHVPSATVRLASHYLPVHSIVPNASAVSTPSNSTEDFGSEGDPTTPKCADAEPTTAQRSTSGYYLNRIGGAEGLAQLFLGAGLLHLEGTATPLLSSAYAGLSSLRSPLVVSGSTGQGYGPSPSGSANGTEAWRRDRECARQYFERARALVPSLDVPLLPPDTDSESGSGAENGDRRSAGSRSSQGDQRKEAQTDLKMPSIDVTKDTPAVQPRRRRKKTSGDLGSSFMENCRSDTNADDEDRTWYLYIPGLVGAGTALLIVGFLSLSSWRKSQSGS